MATPAATVEGLSGALAQSLAQPRRELTYSSVSAPGITRRRCGRGFIYHWPDGRQVRDGDVLARIRKLAIPPAYRDVWICTDPCGHLQATGIDARGRKQYRYHRDWTEQRGAGKFQSLLEFGEALPALRRRMARDLAQPGLGRERVLAAIVKLLQLTLIRVGNREYARSNGSYGLTTLLDEHVEAVRGRLRFHFRAKGGIDREIRLSSRRLCTIVRRCQELPGQTLFQYQEEDGTCVPVTSAQVNEYLRERTGHAFTAKHFRTWSATVMAFSTLARAERPESNTARRRVVSAMLREVANYLGNTPTVCRTSYVHPKIIEAYESGALCGRALRANPTWNQAEQETLEFLTELDAEERRERRHSGAGRPTSAASGIKHAPARPGPSRSAASRTGASRAA